MKNIVELMLKYKQVPFVIVGFIIVFGLLGFLTIQTTNHIPTQIKEIKENHKEVNDRIDRLEDKIDKNYREMNEFFRYLMERDKAKDKK